MIGRDDSGKALIWRVLMHVLIDADRPAQQNQSAALGIDRRIGLAARAKCHILERHLRRAGDHDAPPLTRGACTDLHIFNRPIPLNCDDHCASAFPSKTGHNVVIAIDADNSHLDAWSHPSHQLQPLGRHVLAAGRGIVATRDFELSPMRVNVSGSRLIASESDRKGLSCEPFAPGRPRWASTHKLVFCALPSGRIAPCAVTADQNYNQEKQAHTHDAISLLR